MGICYDFCGNPFPSRWDLGRWDPGRWDPAQVPPARVPPGPCPGRPGRTRPRSHLPGSLPARVAPGPGPTWPGSQVPPGIIVLSNAYNINYYTFSVSDRLLNRAPYINYIDLAVVPSWMNSYWSLLGVPCRVWLAEAQWTSRPGCSIGPGPIGPGPTCPGPTRPVSGSHPAQVPPGIIYIY